MTDIDVGVAYAAGRKRVLELLADLPADQAMMAVPACPDWRVRDVVAHVSGVCVDVLAGRLEGAGTDPWTEAQVAPRRDRTLDEIIAEWNEAAPQVEAIAKDFGPPGKQLLFDFVAHEQDIRGALGVAGGRDSDGWWIGLEFITPGFHAAVAGQGLAPLQIVTGPRTWDPEGVDAVEALTADPFDFGRAISGRRSADQIRGFEWSTDPEPYLAAFTFGPFTPRATDLIE